MKHRRSKAFIELKKNGIEIKKKCTTGIIIQSRISISNKPRFIHKNI